LEKLYYAAIHATGWRRFFRYVKANKEPRRDIEVALKARGGDVVRINLLIHIECISRGEETSVCIQEGNFKTLMAADLITDGENIHQEHTHHLLLSATKRIDKVLNRAILHRGIPEAMKMASGTRA
jgi:hypothetical protein